MATKIVWIDTETTGLNPVKNDIIQIAALMEVDGVVVDKIEMKCAPFSWDNISPQALAVHGYGLEDLRTFEDPRMVQKQFTDWLKKHISPYDKKDKATFAAYNAPFDHGFVKQWFLKAGDKYMNSFFEYKTYDAFPLFIAFCQAIGHYPPNHKLVTAADFFNIEIQAHDALSDIEAAREVTVRIGQYIAIGYETLEGAANAAKANYDPNQEIL